MISRALLLIVCLSLGYPVFAQTNTAGANATIGNENISGNQSMVGGSITIQGGAPVPPAGMMAVPNHQAPTLFQFLPNNYGMPAEITGMALEVFYDQVCRPEEAETESEVRQLTGRSKLTEITITVHPKAFSVKYPGPHRVRTDFTGSKRYYRCLGILTAAASKNAVEKGTPVGLSVVSSDARLAARTQFAEVGGTTAVLSAATFWGGALSVTSDSSAYSMGLNIFSVIGKLMSLGAAPGYSSGSGATSPAARSGFTALILAETSADEEGAIEIGLADLKNPFNGSPMLGGNGVKAEAAKQK